MYISNIWLLTVYEGKEFYYIQTEKKAYTNLWVQDNVEVHKDYYMRPREQTSASLYCTLLTKRFQNICILYTLNVFYFYFSLFQPELSHIRSAMYTFTHFHTFLHLAVFLTYFYSFCMYRVFCLKELHASVTAAGRNRLNFSGVVRHSFTFQMTCLLKRKKKSLKSQIAWLYLLCITKGFDG